MALIRLSKLADYGIVIMTQLARRVGSPQSASEVASATRIPQPTASKILKQLARADLLTSYRGAHGGYGLARASRGISVAEVIEALDGPIALTICLDEGGHECSLEDLCPARANWQRINGAIRAALAGISVEEMASGGEAARWGFAQPLDDGAARL